MPLFASLTIRPYKLHLHFFDAPYMLFSSEKQLVFPVKTICFFVLNIQKTN